MSTRSLTDGTEPRGKDRLVFSFEEGGRGDRLVLGGKGAGLAEMVSLGLPVPPGFVIGCAAERHYRREGALPGWLESELEEHVERLQRDSGRRFGDPDAPLLVSVRSGAPVSMPGMMDTILNVGLNQTVVEALAGGPGDGRFALECYVRLLESFARTVRAIGVGLVEESLMDADEEAGADGDRRLRARVEALLALIEQESEAPFPPDPYEQMLESIAAVFRSWESPRAEAYRRHHGIEDDLGTAVVIQRMVFGNRGEDSGSGVAFTRDPSTGQVGAYGDFLFHAQGEDVVSGERDPQTLDELGARLPEVREELTRILKRLERHERDLCEVEFTVEDGRLWVLQTRVAQRSGRAAVRLAVAFVDEGLISVGEALERVSDEQVEAASVPGFAREPSSDELLARGLPGSPGAAVGTAVFDSGRAHGLAAEGTGPLILLRPTTSPADVQGMIAAAGVVTGRGGRTSHAAVVARGLSRPAVCKVGRLEIDPDLKRASLNGIAIAEGDVVSVDGDRGLVALGDLPLAEAGSDPALERFAGWRREARPS